MRDIEQELDRYLTLLRNKIRERGFTQLEVQEQLGWGRSYISQILTKQKSLRLKQMLSILQVIGIEPVAFFAELHFGRAELPPQEQQTRQAELLGDELSSLRRLVDELTELLEKKGLIMKHELREAVEAQRMDA